MSCLLQQIYKMTQLKSSSPSENNRTESELGNEVLQQSLKVEHQSRGVFGFFVREVSTRSKEIFYSIIGHYGYKPKNQFSYKQKIKILDYLKAKVLTDNTRLKETEKIKFADFDQKFLDHLPNNIQALRSKILKARSHLDAAEKSVEKVKYSREQMTIRYLNEQAYEYDKTKFNSMAWGFLFGAFINCTLYKRGTSVRKIALFLTFGHVFGVYSSYRNLDRFFDSVYPVFQRDAKQFSEQEKEIYLNWQPDGKGQMIE